MRQASASEERSAAVARANALREALGLKEIDVLRGLRATLGRGEAETSPAADYVTAKRWFSPRGRGPSEAALVWLELKAREAGLDIARREEEDVGS